MSVRLTLTDQPDPAHEEAIGAALRAYNEAFAGPPDWRHLAVLLQDGDAVTGGLWGRSGRGFLYIDLLVVPEAQRRAGLGSGLLRMAEEEAARRGCVGAWLFTFSFQARGFYERHGYVCFGTLVDWPLGHASHFMRKRFSGQDAIGEGARAAMAEPDWLPWARELQAIAQTGLAFVRDPYDRERYEMLRSLASRVMAAHTAFPAERIEALFAGENGYATPKVDVRGAAFDAGGRLLMVREVADGARWTLPGGWADVNLTAAESVIKEVREESGFEVRVRKLAAVWDRSRQGHPPAVFSCCKFFFICDIVGGAAATGPETSEVGWFAEHELPDDLSFGRVLPGQLRRMFAHARDAALPTEFE